MHSDCNSRISSLMLMTHLPETHAEIQRHLPARVATKFALVSSASFERENMADDEDAGLLLVQYNILL